MAFELAEINPNSMPINLLNPRLGTKFGDRADGPVGHRRVVGDTRLILPDALFRLCGGDQEPAGPGAARSQGGAERRDDGQLPHHPRGRAGRGPEMFEELGLNVARQPDNGANPRPDNRSGWLEGETPETPIDELIDRQAEANFWDPLHPGSRWSRRERSRHTRSPPAGATRAGPPPAPRRAGVDGPGRLRVVDGPQGPEVMLDGRPVLLLCSNNYLRRTIRGCVAQRPMPRSAWERAQAPRG